MNDFWLRKYAQVRTIHLFMKFGNVNKNKISKSPRQKCINELKDRIVCDGFHLWSPKGSHLEQLLKKGDDHDIIDKC